MIAFFQEAGSWEFFRETYRRMRCSSEVFPFKSESFHQAGSRLASASQFLATLKADPCFYVVAAGFQRQGQTFTSRPSPVPTHAGGFEDAMLETRLPVC